MTQGEDFSEARANAATIADVRSLFSARIRALGYTYFDAGALDAALLARPQQAERFFVCDYYKGNPWKYLPASWPADDPVTAHLSRSSAPFDYLELLRQSPKTASVLLQLGVLKTYGVRKAWLIPCNTLGRLRWVTVYSTEKRADLEEVFAATRDTLVSLALPLVDRLDAMHDEERSRSTIAVVEKVPVELTEQEHACLGRVARGMKNAEIAEQLDIAEATVRFHLKKVYRKIGASNRAEATAFAISNGFVVATD